MNPRAFGAADGRAWARDLRAIGMERTSVQGISSCLLAAMLALLLAGCASPNTDEGSPPTGDDGTPPGGGPPGQSAPSPRVGAAMSYDSARGAIVLFGGHGEGRFLADTWERRGTAWTKMAPATSPPPRTGASLVYDSARQVSVLFGGQSSGGGVGEATFLADTWEWDGAQWKDRTQQGAPGARYYAAAGFDPSRSVMVLFGGSDRGHTAFDEVAEWDGTRWTSYPPAPPSPSARADAPMACDHRRGVCTMFGGDDGTNPTDTWERQGTTWTQRSPAASPPDRRGSTMAYDGARGVTVLFGGHHGSPPPGGNPLADTWEWDGDTWTQRATTAVPAARWAHGMAYDSARAVTVLFGGNGGSTPLGDTWEWNGSGWNQA